MTISPKNTARPRAEEIDLHNDPNGYKKFVSAKLDHLAQHDRIGPPADRSADELDQVIFNTIEALRAELRIYPDLYAWIVTDAIRAYNTSKPVE